MARNNRSTRLILVLGFGLAACSSAYADRISPEPTQRGAALAATPSTSPYEVDLIDQNGNPLNVYQHRGRFYVLGAANQRYTIRVKNPTGRRVEAVLSVDGLDVIDGETADLRKRGYVVPAYGELRVEGFRTSTQHVATFRFSSVANSYAGRKSKARNVGVIGVAIFEEQAPPEIILSAPTGGAHHGHGHHHRRNAPRDLDFEERGLADSADDFDAPEAEAAPAPPPPRVSASKRPARPASPTPRAEPARDIAPAKAGSASGASQSRTRSVEIDGRIDGTRADRCCGDHLRHRPGLGTEFGEQRHSTVSWTRFVRANATRPTAMTELRYNDATGLQALGIRLGPVVDGHELHTRETADPFPGSRGFAAPPTR